MRLLVLVWLALFGSRAYADTIAMLPLDGEKRLSILGQPVAAEIAHALEAAGFDVVVVGARMNVPDTANLIVDGTIKAAKAKQVDVSIRIRDPRDGSTLETLPAPTTKLDDLDKTAAALSSRVVPAVKSQLEALAKKATKPIEQRPIEQKPIEQRPANPAPAGPTVIAQVMASSSDVAALTAQLDKEAGPWATTLRFSAKVSFQVTGYAVKTGKVPMARARVHVTIGDAGGAIKFDRVVVTDTIVGDVDQAPDLLAARTAREVLAIVRPHVLRALRQ